MPSPIFDATFQAVTLSALSNALAQILRAYRQQSLSAIDTVTFLHFVLFALLITPPNYAFQNFLEHSFPTTTTTTTTTKPSASENQGLENDGKVAIRHEEKFSITNTAIKFFLDQSLGAAVNTVLFIAAMGMFKGMGADDILANARQDFWSMLLTGYKLWPMVCLLNLVVVPFEHRMLVGNTAAFGWGVYMSLCSL